MNTDDEGRDLLADMAPASWHAPPEWWRGFAAGLDARQRAELAAGRLSITVLGRDGVERVPLTPPPWLVVELGGPSAPAPG